MRIEPLGCPRSGEGNARPLPAKISDEKYGTWSCSTSSIGRDSDASSESEENEAESAYNGPLYMMEALEEVLPIRRGISKFYNGKSKSFTSLVDLPPSPSIKGIAKADNAYNRRRRNLMAFNHVNFALRRSNNGGISKTTISSSRSALALAFALNYDSSSSCTSEDSTSSRSLACLPPLHPRNRASITSILGPSSPLQQNFSPWLLCNNKNTKFLHHRKLT